MCHVSTHHPQSHLRPTPLPHRPSPPAPMQPVVLDICGCACPLPQVSENHMSVSPTCSAKQISKSSLSLFKVSTSSVLAFNLSHSYSVLTNPSVLVFQLSSTGDSAITFCNGLFHLLLYVNNSLLCCADRTCACSCSACATRPTSMLIQTQESCVPVSGLVVVSLVASCNC